MKLGIIFAALLTPFLIATAVSVSAQQPNVDDIDIDVSGCGYTIEWIDGTQTALKLTYSVNGVTKPAINLDDVVGDQSQILVDAKGNEGDKIRAVLDLSGDAPDVVRNATLGACPTSTSTATATPTNTAVPSTATPLPTLTPVPSIPTPVVIIQTVEVPVVRTVIQPPSTGDAGLK